MKKFADNLPDWQSYKDADILPDGTIWAVGDVAMNDLSAALVARFTPGKCPK
jgi:hypothetical protein